MALDEEVDDFGGGEELAAEELQLSFEGVQVFSKGLIGGDSTLQDQLSQVSQNSKYSFIALHNLNIIAYHLPTLSRQGRGTRRHLKRPLWRF